MARKFVDWNREEADIQRLIGIAALNLFAWTISERRGTFPLRTVAAVLVLQLVREALLLLNHVVAALQDATLVGSRFVFGYPAGGLAPYQVTNPGSNLVLALQVLVISALSALLYHWRGAHPGAGLRPSAPEDPGSRRRWRR